MTAAWIGLAISMLLSGCATMPSQAPAAALFDDALFAAQAESIRPDDVFAPSAPMLRFIESDITAVRGSTGLQRGLFDALYSRGEPWLDYDATTTRNAAEAFAARSGNCLSLVLMTASFARQLGLPVRYQSVVTQEAWSRGQGLDYLNAHVNVTLLDPRRGETAGASRAEMLIDFLTVPANEVQRVRVLQEATIVAMYMNNRAVELLAQGELDRAYWWAKAAIGQDNHYLGATNTLAVIYKARGMLREAERALRWILAVEPDNIVALDNLLRVLQAQQRDAEAAVVAAHLRELRPIPPFHYYDLGLQALGKLEFAKARDLFLREMRRDANYDKFHASLALAYYGLGDLDGARTQMALAHRNSTTSAERRMYAQMLARLRAGEHP